MALVLEENGNFLNIFDQERITYNKSKRFLSDRENNNLNAITPLGKRTAISIDEYSRALLTKKIVNSPLKLSENVENRMRNCLPHSKRRRFFNLNRFWNNGGAIYRRLQRWEKSWILEHNPVYFDDIMAAEAFDVFAADDEMLHSSKLINYDLTVNFPGIFY